LTCNRSDRWKKPYVHRLQGRPNIAIFFKFSTAVTSAIILNPDERAVEPS